jgi:hypothetical protein
MGIEKEPQLKSKSVVEESLEIENYSRKERVAALAEMSRLKKSFSKELKKPRSKAEKIGLIKQRFDSSANPEKVSKFLGNNSESIDAIFSIALLGEFLWGKEGYQHEDFYIYDKFPEAKGEEKIMKRSEYLKKHGYNNLHKTLIKKTGDCNRLGTILIGLAQANNIPLKAFACESHFATAIQVGGKKVMLDTGRGRLFFAEDFQKDYLWEGHSLTLGDNDRVLVENLRDEFLTTLVGPNTMGKGEVSAEEVARLRKMAKRLLEMNIGKIYGEKHEKYIQNVLEIIDIDN